MPIKSEPYYFAVCDNCGDRADYGDFSAWKDHGAAADKALASDWTEKDGVFHCPGCPSLADDDEEDDDASASTTLDAQTLHDSPGSDLADG